MTVAQRTLWVAAFGAAGAWSLNLLTVVAVGSARCVSAPGPVPQFGATWRVLLVITAVALAGAVWATWVSVRSLRQAGPGPSAGRVRFMAFGGLLLNAVFLLGLGFSTIALFLVPVCF